jgi:F-type H+-transporting ATPase subunit c
MSILVESNNMLATRSIQTSASVRDVETAAKFIGAGAATVGCAGIVTGQDFVLSFVIRY